MGGRRSREKKEEKHTTDRVCIAKSSETPFFLRPVAEAHDLEYEPLAV